VVYCQGCLEKQRIIDRLEEENRRLKERLRYQERKATEGFFGCSTPSSKVPVKPNTLAERQAKRGGTKPGHVGHGRQAVAEEEADRVEEVEMDDTCPCCGGTLEDKGLRSRTVVDCQAVRTEKILYRLQRRWCPLRSPGGAARYRLRQPDCASAPAVAFAGACH